jgi:hypothetical protein
MRAESDYALTLWLARRPFFCCGCWCLAREDAQRTKRVLRFVRAVMKDWEEDRRIRAEAAQQA